MGETYTARDFIKDLMAPVGVFAITILACSVFSSNYDGVMIVSLSTTFLYTLIG